MRSSFAAARRASSRRSAWVAAALLFACNEASPDGAVPSVQNGGKNGSGATSAGASMTPAGSGGSPVGSSGGAAGGTSGGSPGSSAGSSGQANTGGSPDLGGSPNGGSHDSSGSPNGGNLAGGDHAGGSHAGNSSLGGSSGGGESTKTHDGPWHIMPMGDSITGTTCYPQLLSKKLRDAGRTQFDFIGSNLNNQSCNGAPNVQTEGHGGYLVTYLVDDNPKPMANKGSLTELNQWLSAAPAPDVLLLLHGTNDVWNGIAPATITSAYSFVLGKVREKNPSVITFVGTLLPMHPNGCVDSTRSCENNRVNALNAQIPTWAMQASSASSPVYVVDVNASVNAGEFMPNSALTGDGVHPTATASESMAQVWYDALVERGIP